jgi:hypothetical protein
VGRVAFVLLAGSLVALVAGPGRASLYSPDELRFTVPVGPDGKAQALDFAEFKRQLASVTNFADDRRKADGKFNSDREMLLQKIEQRKGKKLSADETTALATDLLRAGRPESVDEALNRIKPLVLDRRPTYFALSMLAHVHAARGEWREAFDNQDFAVESGMPEEVKGWSRPQRDWMARIDRDFVLPYYLIRMKEANAPRANPADEDVYPLFPVAERGKPHQPVRFVNEAGAYEPGVLAANERAKLPPDAIPVVQQLMFWFPADTRLYWLLAELYAADRQFGPARDIMDVAVSAARQYGNRRILVEHRALVRSADDAQPRKATDEPLLSTTTEPAAPAEPTEKAPISMRTIWIYFGVVGLIALFAFIRAMSRRVRGDRGPAG